MNWIVVNSQVDLDDLNSSVCWEDSESIEYYATIRDEEYFPNDVSRSGYVNKNIHLLCQVCSSRERYLEMVLIDCDRLAPRFLDRPFMNGRVDTLKRIEIVDYRGDLRMRCSRLIYRFHRTVDSELGAYFCRRDPEDADRTADPGL